jgi:hypothetical protein
VPVTVQWRTVFVPGAPPSSFGPQAPVTDYLPSSGIATFAMGQQSAIVDIPVTQGSNSPAEYVVVALSNSTNAQIGGFYGLGFGFIVAPA